MTGLADESGTQTIDRNGPAFLSGGGELGQLIRAKDWSSTPLGSPETWPESLRTSVSTCLNCSFPILIWWGPELVKIYNDAYAEIIAKKHPWSLGSPGRDVWPEIWDTIGPMLSRVMEAGEAFPADDLRLDLHRNGYPEECYFSFSYSPIRDESGQVAGVFCPVIETTDRVFAERRSAFLLDLEARLRNLSDPHTVKSVVSDLIGNHLGVAQASYSEVQHDNSHVLVEGAWDNGRVKNLSGFYRLDDFGPALIADLRRDVVVAVVDVEDDVRTSSPEALARFAQIEMRSFVDVPLFKAGQLVAFLAIGDCVPRRWADHEIALLRDVAERTWSAVERTRAETARQLSQSERERDLAALKISEARFRTLADAMPQLVWTAHPDGARTWYNDGWYRYTGSTPEMMEGWGWQSVHDPELLPAVLARWQACINTSEPFEMTIPLRGADGSFRPFLTRAVPQKDDEGRVVQWYGTNTDVDELRRAEEKQNLLLKEMDHRVKNLFAIVNGIIALSARTAATPKGLADDIQGRLGALASAHQLVRVRELDAPPDQRETTLDDLIRAVLAPYVASSHVGDAARIVTDGPRVVIGGDAITSFALVFHELATNAAKYGAFSAASGQVAIKWSFIEGGLQIIWRERGGPPVTSSPQHEGFGSLLARRSVQGQLGGQLAYDWDFGGLVVRLSAAAGRLGA
jgi:PAS domain S-box-containing protein